MQIVDDLMKDKDGWSLTKITAAVAHLNLSIAFVHITWTAGFIPELWLIYGSFAILHRIWTSSAQQFKDFKEKQLDLEHPPQPQ